MNCVLNMKSMSKNNKKLCVVYGNVFLGRNVRIDPFAVLGGDGFGYERDAKFELSKVLQEGGVVIGDNVDIGSFTCIDRAEGKGTNTIIGEGTKIDNLVHVAHNVVIGKHCGLAAGVCLGGSVEVGDFSFLGVGAVVLPKVRVGKYCMVGAGSVMVHDIPDNVVVAGNPARVLRQNNFFAEGQAH